MALEVVGKGRGQKTAGGVLAGILHIALVEAALSGNFLDQFLVIAGNTKRLGGLFADGAAAAAKLTADGDNAVFHGDTPFRERETHAVAWAAEARSDAFSWLRS